ncbi:MAG TPA: glycosyltransferase [Steroidobacteraceae bacterium]|nr:glycosyltransferase [Steroidobacteraceae bacterium]
MLYLALLPVLIWLYLLLARGDFWRVGRLLSTDTATAGASARVVAVIPARNEAGVVGLAVQSLLGQRFAGDLHIVVIDDASSDGTAEVVRETAQRAGAATRVTLIRGSGPEPGWSGKVCAMARGVGVAAALQPDYLLFTDADIHHEPDHVARLVANARRLDVDLLSSMVLLTVSNSAERWLIPAFVFFFLKLYPPAWIAREGAATAGAAGGCMLVRPQALARSGGLAAIRSHIIDDCALARSIKRAGGRVCLGLTREARSLRPYGSWQEIGRMIARTAFNQLRHSWLLLFGTLLGLVVTYLMPPLLLFSGSRAGVACGAGAWAIMSLCYAPMVRFYRLNLLWTLTLPAAAAFYAAATVYSAWQFQLGRGGQWKGRAQDSPGP